VWLLVKKLQNKLLEIGSYSEDRSGRMMSYKGRERRNIRFWDKSEMDEKDDSRKHQTTCPFEENHKGHERIIITVIITHYSFFYSNTHLSLRENPHVPFLFVWTLYEQVQVFQTMGTCTLKWVSFIGSLLTKSFWLFSYTNLILNPVEISEHEGMTNWVNKLKGQRRREVRYTTQNLRGTFTT